ncbi:TPA: hypothetical protein HA265_02530 [Candidatus Woesearchaeota archaeon]|nr:hypothetical protein [Candidatus Woesearchaeota archaeon]
MRRFHKKGFAMPMEELIGTILSVVTVLGTLALFIALMAIFLNPPSAGSAKTVNDFHEFVFHLYLPENKNESYYSYNFFVEQNWFIAGLNSDGVTSLTTNDATCGPNKDCVEEMCGPVKYSDLTKPASCGPGPCVCLCYEGKTGDPGGDDCKKRGAICKPFNKDIGFRRFVRWSKGYCTTKWKDRDSCDLIYDGEACTVRGKAQGLQYGTTYEKSGNNLNFMFVESEAEKKSVSTVRCRQMVRDLKAKKKPEAKEGPKVAPKGDAVTAAFGKKK